MILGLTGPLGPLLMTLGSLSLVVVFAVILRMEFALYTVTMAGGALLWLVGNGLWFFGQPVYTVVLWWSGSLVLTVAGERLELGRVRRPPPSARVLFSLAVGLVPVGLLVSLVAFDPGVRIVSGGLLALAVQLLRYDVARHTVKREGLTRFIALCLVSGYGWLGIGDLLGLRFGGLSGGFYYDALHHAIFVGFVISMIFGHAPIIFPAVLRKPLTFQPRFYSHLLLLHLSLLLRVGSDLALWLSGRKWGGLLNVFALLLFLANTVWAVRETSKNI